MGQSRTDVVRTHVARGKFMGLATGPMIGSFVLSGGRYDILIMAALALLVLSALAASLPALRLDHSSTVEPG